MRAGELDRLVTIEVQDYTQSDSGEPTEYWREFAKVYAKVSHGRTSERFTAQQMNATVDTVFRIRWVNGITTDMRIKHGGDYYDIVGVPAEIGRRAGLDIPTVLRRA